VVGKKRVFLKKQKQKNVNNKDLEFDGRNKWLVLIFLWLCLYKITKRRRRLWYNL